VLDVQDIHTYYGDSYILQGVSLHVGESSIVAVLGRNGVGKSTLVRSIIGFTPPRAGKMVFDEVNLVGLTPERIARLGVGLVPQGRRIFGSLTVRENLLVAERETNRGKGWTPADVLKLFPRLQERYTFNGKSLSGGEQQMLACGRGLVGDPRVLLMDEPTEGLSPIFVRELGRLIEELKAQGTAVLLVEQNLGFALRLADYVYVMNKGQIVHESSPDELQNNEEVKSRYLGI